MDIPRILIIDDEPDLREIISFNLRIAGYQCDCADSAEAACAMSLSDFALIILDVMMPGMSGFEFARMLKSDASTDCIPIIFLTAKDMEDDKLQGFELGADDYVSKPFSTRELVARVRAVLQRSAQKPDIPLSLEYESLRMDLVSKHVSVEGMEVSFTPTEFALLELLLSHRGITFSRAELLERIWPKDVIVTERTVDVNIARMRKKIGRYSSCIVTRLGFGYCFV